MLLYIKTLQKLKFSGKSIISALILLGALGLVARGALALLNPHQWVYSVTIDGTIYGEFPRIEGLDQVLDDGETKIRPDGMIVFERVFIAEPSLFKWAIDNQEGVNRNSYDIWVELKEHDGGGYSRVVLKDVKPVSWTLKANQVGSGGYYEKIAVVYQDFDVY